MANNNDRVLVLEEPDIEDTCEQLFLLEVLVDKINIKTEGLLGAIEKQEIVEEEQQEEEEEEEDDDDDEERARRRREQERRKRRSKANRRPLKVKVRFFNFPTIEIDEWDFTEIKQEKQFELEMLKGGVEEDSEEEELRAEEEGMTVEEWREERERRRRELAEEIANSMPPGNRFCSGKSCLFPMIPLDLVNGIKKAPLQVQVHRSGDGEHAQRLIGRTSIQLGQNFIEAISLASTPIVLPVSAFIDGPYELKNVFGEVTAIVYLYVRISCFGNSIFTQFKLKEGEEDYHFKMSGKNIGTADRMKNKKGISPKLIPIFTKNEDFKVGATAPRVNHLEPQLKPPINWHKKGEHLPLMFTLVPTKLFLNSPTKPQYRKNIPKKINILQHVIPGFGRQTADTNFIKENPTIPRKCEIIDTKIDKEYLTVLDDKMATAQRDLENSLSSETSNIHAPGVKLPCQFGATWSPLQFPLPTQNLYPPLEEVWKMARDIEMENCKKMPSMKEAKEILQKRRSSLDREKILLALNTANNCTKCTCLKIAHNIECDYTFDISKREPGRTFLPNNKMDQQTRSVVNNVSVKNHSTVRVFLDSKQDETQKKSGAFNIYQDDKENQSQKRSGAFNIYQDDKDNQSQKRSGAFNIYQDDKENQSQKRPGAFNIYQDDKENQTQKNDKPNELIINMMLGIDYEFDNYFSSDQSSKNTWRSEKEQLRYQKFSPLKFKQKENVLNYNRETERNTGKFVMHLQSQNSKRKENNFVIYQDDEDEEKLKSRGKKEVNNVSKSCDCEEESGETSCDLMGEEESEDDEHSYDSYDSGNSSDLEGNKESCECGCVFKERKPTQQTDHDKKEDSSITITSLGKRKTVAKESFKVKTDEHLKKEEKTEAENKKVLREVEEKRIMDVTKDSLNSKNIASGDENKNKVAEKKNEEKFEEGPAVSSRESANNARECHCSNGKRKGSKRKGDEEKKQDKQDFSSVMSSDLEEKSDKKVREKRNKNKLQVGNDYEQLMGKMNNSRKVGDNVSAGAEKMENRKEEEILECAKLKSNLAPLELFSDLIKCRGRLYECPLLKGGRDKDKDSSRLKVNEDDLYVYTDGLYPTKTFGHKKCVPADIKVPRNRGWIKKQIKDAKRMINSWKDAACTNNTNYKKRNVNQANEQNINKKLVEKLKKKNVAENRVEEDRSENKEKNLRKKEKRLSDVNKFSQITENYRNLTEGKIESIPTLHLHKKNGIYTAVMIPSIDPLLQANDNLEHFEKSRIVLTFNPKHPDGSVTSSGDESDDTSTISEDSMMLDFTCPLALSKQVPPTLFRSFAAQTTPLSPTDNPFKPLNFEANSSSSSESFNFLYPSIARKKENQVARRADDEEFITKHNIQPESRKKKIAKENQEGKPGDKLMKNGQSLDDYSHPRKSPDRKNKFVNIQESTKQKLNLKSNESEKQKNNKRSIGTGKTEVRTVITNAVRKPLTGMSTGQQKDDQLKVKLIRRKSTISPKPSTLTSRPSSVLSKNNAVIPVSNKSETLSKTKAMQDGLKKQLLYAKTQKTDVRTGPKKHVVIVEPDPAKDDAPPKLYEPPPPYALPKNRILKTVPKY